MVDSSDANTLPEGTTLVFGSWACTADGSGGFTGRLITSKEPEVKFDDQPAGIADDLKIGKNQAPPKLNSEDLENMSTLTRADGLAESDTNPNSENPQFSQSLRKYMAYLKSIKHPKVVNSELFDGVDRVSRSIKGCIKLAKFALGSSKTQQNPETSNPRHSRTGDMFSGIDRVDSSLINYINVAENILQHKKKDSIGKSCGKPEKANPRLERMRLPLPGKP